MQINDDISPEVQQAKMRFSIIGNAPALTAAVQRAIKVAPIDLSVLVTGESGVGKEFFPKIIHAYSSRKHARYIAVNCGAIPEGTIDSELFGHEKGAFTGAISARKGYFEEADGGTIFLDEVAELPLTTQARLLRVLENGEFLKVGSSTVQRTNVRIVAATNVDMLKAVAEGKFREDLFYRLSTVQIQVPPLRSRGNDIVLLARKFAVDFAERYRTPAIILSDDARRVLLHYSWPGNVRQLKNVMEQTSLFQAGMEVGADDLHRYLPSDTTGFAPAVAHPDHSYAQEREILFNMIFRMQREIDSLRSQLSEQKPQHESPLIDMPRSLVAVNRTPDSLRPAPIDVDVSEVTTHEVELNPDSSTQSMTLEDTERETIRRVLEKHSGRRKAAAKELNISERTLYRKIKEYNLE